MFLSFQTPFLLGLVVSGLCFCPWLFFFLCVCGCGCLSHCWSWVDVSWLGLFSTLGCSLFAPWLVVVFLWVWSSGRQFSCFFMFKLARFSWVLSFPVWFSLWPFFSCVSVGVVACYTAVLGRCFSWFVLHSGVFFLFAPWLVVVFLWVWFSGRQF